MTFKMSVTKYTDDRQHFYTLSPGRVAAKSDSGKCKAGQRRGILRVGGSDVDQDRQETESISVTTLSSGWPA
mgnify:CR=1 FL=1